MTAPFKAAYIRESSGPDMVKRFIVCLDQDAAEIMGETKTRYVYATRAGAERFCKALQTNFDASFADAC